MPEITENVDLTLNKYTSKEEIQESIINSKIRQHLAKGLSIVRSRDYNLFL